MITRLGRLLAGLKVALIFGVIWSVLVTLAVLAISVVTTHLLTGLQYLLVLGFYSILGAIQGIVVAAVMAWSGERGDLTVDTYPRLLGGAIGFLTGVAGMMFAAASEVWGSGRALWSAIPWSVVGLVGASGSIATVLLLTIARRGSTLPPAPPPAGQIGR